MSDDHVSEEARMQPDAATTAGSAAAQDMDLYRTFGYDTAPVSTNWTKLSKDSAGKDKTIRDLNQRIVALGQQHKVEVDNVQKNIDSLEKQHKLEVEKMQGIIDGLKREHKLEVDNMQKTIDGSEREHNLQINNLQTKLDGEKDKHKGIVEHSKATVASRDKTITENKAKIAQLEDELVKKDGMINELKATVNKNTGLESSRAEQIQALRDELAEAIRRASELSTAATKANTESHLYKAQLRSEAENQEQFKKFSDGLKADLQSKQAEWMRVAMEGIKAGLADNIGAKVKQELMANNASILTSMEQDQTVQMRDQAIEHLNQTIQAHEQTIAEQTQKIDEQATKIEEQTKKMTEHKAAFQNHLKQEQAMHEKNRVFVKKMREDLMAARAEEAGLKNALKKALELPEDASDVSENGDNEEEQEA